MKKLSLIFLACLLMLFSFAGCTAGKATKNIEVCLVNQLDGTTVSATLSLPDASMAGEYFRQLANKNDILLKGVDEGYVHTVGDTANSDTYAWMFYVNGALSSGGINDYNPADGDKIDLIYLDWTQLSFE